jgi:hypothetical protein
MNRPNTLLGMIAAAALSAAVAAPAALAGNEILKCVDTEGHVTLTDQPCDTGSATVRLSSEPPQQSQLQSQSQSQPQRHVVTPAELRHAGWKQPPVVRAAPLSRDVATLKAARRMMMLQETKPRLAGLN